jgi:protoporphyrinogen/coproporphyrinogen III oxidase
VRLAVIGGGIAGLSAAWELAGHVGDRAIGERAIGDRAIGDRAIGDRAIGDRAIGDRAIGDRAISDRANVTVYEPGHLGGKLRTTEFLGRPVDEGPDALLTRVPEGLAMCSELGLGDQLEATQANRALLFSGGKLQPLPEGLVLGAPARLVPVLRSRILSVGGVGRASLDLVLPRSGRSSSGRTGEDVSVFDLVASRLGPEVAERLVEPLLGSIHAGSTRQLSAAATAPQLLAAAQANRSLITGLRQATKGRTSAPSANPLFVAPRLGMQSIADRLVERLRAAGTNFVSLKVASLRCEHRSIIVEPDGEHFDGAILALPAPAAFSLLRPVLDSGKAPGLAAMEFASVAVVTLAFDAAAFDDFARGLFRGAGSSHISGILVAPGSGLLMTACSFGSNKWPHWAAPGTAILRVSVGRAADQTWAGLTDEALVERLCDELETVLGQRSAAVRATLHAPLACRVSRWPQSMPQYLVGHLERVASAAAVLTDHAPMVRLAGASYNGVGVPACIGSGRRAARELLAALETLGLPAS